MKLIIDGDPSDFSSAMSFFFRATANNPTQKQGKENAIKATAGQGRQMSLIRNTGSYTVKITSKGTV